MSPTWTSVHRIKYKMVSGHSVRSAVLEATKDLQSDFESYLFRWAQRFPQDFEEQIELTDYQSSLKNLLSDGMRGKPIYESLCQLEEDIRESLIAEIDEHVQKLPFLGPEILLNSLSLFVTSISSLAIATEAINISISPTGVRLSFNSFLIFP